MHIGYINHNFNYLSPFLTSNKMKINDQDQENMTAILKITIGGEYNCRSQNSVRKKCADDP